MGSFEMIRQHEVRERRRMMLFFGAFAIASGAIIASVVGALGL